MVSAPDGCCWRHAGDFEAVLGNGREAHHYTDKQGVTHGVTKAPKFKLAGVLNIKEFYSLPVTGTFGPAAVLRLILHSTQQHVGRSYQHWLPLTGFL